MRIEPDAGKRDTLRLGYSFTVTNLPYAVTLGGAYDGGGASPVGLQAQVICCSGR